MVRRRKLRRIMRHAYKRRALNRRIRRGGVHL